MLKLRVVYIVSLLILGVLVPFAIFNSMGKVSEYSEVAKVQLIERENEYIVEFDIINREGKAMKYIFNALIDGEIDSRNCTIQDGGTFTYIYHIYPEQMNDKMVTFTVFREGESKPFEEITYHVN